MRLVVLSVGVCSSSPRVTHNRQERWRPPVKTSTLAEIYMPGHERLLVATVFVHPS